MDELDKTTSSIEEIKRNPIYPNDDDIVGLIVKLKDTCPICMKHNLLVLSHALDVPTVPLMAISTVYCESCGPLFQSSIPRDMCKDSYKDYIDIVVTENLSERFEKDIVHAYRRRCLYDVVNGKEIIDFDRFKFEEGFSILESKYGECPGRTTGHMINEYWNKRRSEIE